MYCKFTVILKSESKQIILILNLTNTQTLFIPGRAMGGPSGLIDLMTLRASVRADRGLCRRSFVKAWREADLCGSKRFLLDSIVDNPSNPINKQTPPCGSSSYSRPVSLIFHLFHQWSQSLFRQVYSSAW